MKKSKETAPLDVSRTSSNPGNHGEVGKPLSPPRLSHGLFSGDGWTTAVSLDDAFAPELLQTWSLQDEAEEDAEEREAAVRIARPDDAPAVC